MVLSASSWFAAFLLTLAVECPVAAVLLRRWEPSRVRLIVLIVFANLATHPAVWYVFPQFFPISAWTFMASSEIWAAAAEALFYWAAFRGLPPERAITVSVAANASSFLVGLAIGQVWPALLR